MNFCVGFYLFMACSCISSRPIPSFTSPTLSHCVRPSLVLILTGDYGHTSSICVAMYQMKKCIILVVPLLLCAQICNTWSLRWLTQCKPRDQGGSTSRTRNLLIQSYMA
jgi:hypothetical protein